MPRAAARRSRVVPRSKQLGSQTRRCRAEQAAGQGSNKPTSHERDLDVSINSMAIFRFMVCSLAKVFGPHTVLLPKFCFPPVVDEAVRLTGSASAFYCWLHHHRTAVL